MGTWDTTNWIWDTSSVTSGTVTVSDIGGGYYAPCAEKKKEPETALAWLDRRVDEIRLEL